MALTPSQRLRPTALGTGSALFEWRLTPRPALDLNLLKGALGAGAWRVPELIGLVVFVPCFQQGRDCLRAPDAAQRVGRCPSNLWVGVDPHPLDQRPHGPLAADVVHQAADVPANDRVGLGQQW